MQLDNLLVIWVVERLEDLWGFLDCFLVFDQGELGGCFSVAVAVAYDLFKLPAFV